MALDLDAIRFPGQQSDERVFLFLRRHWVSFVGSLLIILFMSLLPIVLAVFFGLLNFNVESMLTVITGNLNSAYPEIRARQLMILFYSAYYLFVASYFLILWLDFYFDITIVTNERVIDIAQEGLFNRSVSELYLSQIQDVSGKQNGFIQNLFAFGNVVVQTAGEKENFVINDVANSYQVARKIVDLQEMLLERKKNIDDSVQVG